LFLTNLYNLKCLARITFAKKHHELRPITARHPKYRSTRKRFARRKIIANLSRSKRKHFPLQLGRIYFANHDTQTLHLGPYVGEPTDHTVIPFGKGICGQVAVSNENFVVPDVQAQDNYIACSFTVKSEIVVPLFVNGVNIGQIDIDSNVDPFSEADERFLEFVNEEVSKLF
jgi:GAF domain-containing protein